MNIDILDSSPPWWLYLPFAGGTLLVVLTVWILFKRYNNVSWSCIFRFKLMTYPISMQLEETIERKFGWLVSPQPIRSLEAMILAKEEKLGWTSQYSAFGKKRS